MDRPLNNEEVGRIAGKTVTMVLNTDMSEYTKLEDLFATDCVLINYMTAKNYGHWVGLHMSENGNVVTFFDSYGRLPDGALEFIPMKYRVESNQEFPHLSKLLIEWLQKSRKHSVRYNDEQFQRYSSKIQTCGRWVGLYFRFSDVMTVEEFEEIFEGYLREAESEGMRGVERDLLFDRTVTRITDNILKHSLQ